MYASNSVETDKTNKNTFEDLEKLISSNFRPDPITPIFWTSIIWPNSSWFNKRLRTMKTSRSTSNLTFFKFIVGERHNLETLRTHKTPSNRGSMSDVSILESFDFKDNLTSESGVKTSGLTTPCGFEQPTHISTTSWMFNENSTSRIITLNLQIIVHWIKIHHFNLMRQSTWSPDESRISVFKDKSVLIRFEYFPKLWRKRFYGKHFTRFSW